MQTSFLVSFASVLCVAAVTTVVFQRLKLPVVLGYLLAGLFWGPSSLGAALTNPKAVHTLAKLGVISPSRTPRFWTTPSRTPRFCD